MASGVDVLQMRGDFWNQVICGRYGETRVGWLTPEVKEGCGWAMESDKEGFRSREI